MAEANEVLQVLFDVTEKAKAAAENLKSMAEEVPETETAMKLIEARSIMIAQNKLLRITVETLMKYEDQRQEIVRRFEERM